MTKATAASTHDPPIGPSTACPPRAVAARVAAYAQASGNGPAAWEGRDELCLLRPVCSRTTSHDAGRSLSVSTVRCLCRRASARAAQLVSQASRTEAERDVRKTKAGMYRGRRPVLIGVEGSVSAQGALAWAAAEASYRHCPLQIVHAFAHDGQPGRPGHRARAASRSPDHPESRFRAEGAVMTPSATRPVPGTLVS